MKKFRDSWVAVLVLLVFLATVVFVKPESPAKGIQVIGGLEINSGPKEITFEVEGEGPFWFLFDSFQLVRNGNPVWRFPETREDGTQFVSISVAEAENIKLYRAVDTLSREVFFPEDE